MRTETLFFVYYEEMKRELKRILIYMSVEFFYYEQQIKRELQSFDVMMRDIFNRFVFVVYY